MKKMLNCVCCKSRLIIAKNGDGQCVLTCVGCDYESPVYSSVQEAEAAYQELQRAIMFEAITVPGPQAIWANCELHGWHKPLSSFVEDLALIHSEVSEALEAYRNNEGNARIVEELADIVIRVLHTAAKNNFDLEGAIWAKHRKNIDRPYRHGNKVI